MRIGIDVGGTNTDAVLMDGASVVSWYKTRTTPDVSSGIISALEHVLHESQAHTDRILGVMIGTTHFTNAIVERKRVIPVARSSSPRGLESRWSMVTVWAARIRRSSLSR